MVFSDVKFWCCARYPKVVSFARVTTPVSEGSSPTIIFNRVDLPAPLGPTIAAFSWFSILKEQLDNIISVPNDLLILLQDKIISVLLPFVFY